jgi:carboxylesterase
LDETTALTLTKNIWELEQQVATGRASAQTRLMLLRSYAEHVSFMEETLQIPPEHRSFLRIRENRKDAVLLIHGSTGSPADLRDLGDHLYQAGFTVYGMRAPDHPADGSALAMTPWQAVVVDAENRYRMLANCCPNVYVLGFSFGAAAALNLDVKPRPRALVLVAPALYPRLNFAQRILISIGLERLGWVRRRLGWNAELLDGMEAARKQKWWREIPLFATMADDDPRIDGKSLGFLRSRSKHKETEFLNVPTGGHMVLRDGPRDEICDAVVDFLKKN